EGGICRLELEADRVGADFFDAGNVGNERLVHWRLVACWSLEGEDYVLDRDRLTVVPGHAGAQLRIHGRGVDVCHALGGPGFRQAVGPDAHQAVPDEIGHPAVDGSGNV